MGRGLLCVFCRLVEIHRSTSVVGLFLFVGIQDAVLGFAYAS
jgi:hypothetical protein